MNLIHPKNEIIKIYLKKNKCQGKLDTLLIKNIIVM